jgi:hypothetical protein
MKKVVVLIKDPEQQYEGLRTSLGLLLDAVEVTMCVLDNEIADFNEAYSDNFEFIDEMDGESYSNNETNIEKYGFKAASYAQMVEMMNAADVVIPF